jgi:hypothetical protein
MEMEKFEEAVRDFEQMNKMEKGSQEYRQLLANAKLELKKSKRKDYYKILGVTRSANDEEIKKGYRKRALVHHPGNTEFYIIDVLKTIFMVKKCPQIAMPGPQTKKNWNMKENLKRSARPMVSSQTPRNEHDMTMAMISMTLKAMAMAMAMDMAVKSIPIKFSKRSLAAAVAAEEACTKDKASILEELPLLVLVKCLVVVPFSNLVNHHRPPCKIAHRDKYCPKKHRRARSIYSSTANAPPNVLGLYKGRADNDDIIESYLHTTNIQKRFSSI